MAALPGSGLKEPLADVFETVALTIGVRTEPAKTSLERTHFAGIVPHGALVDEHDPAERQLRPRTRRAGWVPWRGGGMDCSGSRPRPGSSG
jgi:hypothetical protein